MTTTAVIDTFFVSAGCPLTKVSTVIWKSEYVIQEIASRDQEDQQQLYGEDLEEMNGMYVNFFPFK